VANPWLKKNPFMSMWLSGANAITNRARGQATVAVKQEQAKLTRQATKFWTSAWFPSTKSKRR
jgi:hypothetical protein